MSPIQAITTCLRKSFQCSGRASRSEYFGFAVFCLVGSTVLWFPAMCAKVGIHNGITQITSFPAFKLFVVLAFMLLFFALNNAVIRRQHDLLNESETLDLPRPLPFFPATFRSFFGANSIVGILAQSLSIVASLMLAETNPSGLASAALWFGIVGTAIFLVTHKPLIAPSQPGPNRYGPNPLEVTP